MVPNPDNMKENTTPALEAPQPWSPEKIKEAIEKAGLSQRAIAERHSMTPQAIWQAVNGTTTGRLSRQAVAESLGIQVAEIWPDALKPLRERRLRNAS